MMVSFVLSFFPRDVLDEILNLIESVSEDFPSYSLASVLVQACFCLLIVGRPIQLSFALFKALWNFFLASLYAVSASACTAHFFKHLLASHCL